MKIGLLGCGGMGITHCMALKALAQTEDIEVAALADCRPEFLNKAAEYWPQAAQYSTGMDLLENARLDTVHICLPSYLHTEHAVKAMQRGLHVLIEKPVCLTESECGRLLEAKKQATGKVFVGQVVRFFEEYLYLKQIYQSGKYGKLKSISLQRLSGDVTWGFEDWFHNEAKSGSVILDLHVHDVDFLRYLLGEPDDVAVNATSNPMGMPTHIYARYRFGNIVAIAEGLWDVSPALPFEAAYRACFEKATVVYNANSTPALVVYHADGTVLTPAIHPQLATVDASAGINISAIGPYYTEIKYFVERILAGKEPSRASLEDAVQSARLAMRELQLVKTQQYT